MDGDRRYVSVAGPNQWARCRHEHTALLDGGGVQLDWVDPEPEDGGSHPRPAGLAFDAACTAYHTDGGGVIARPLFPGNRESGRSPFDSPVAVAVDQDERLYVAGRDRVAVADLESGRVLRRVAVPGVVDVAARPGGGVFALAGGRLLTLRGRRDPKAGPELIRPAVVGCPSPLRLTVTPDGQVVVLWVDAAVDGAVATADGTVARRGVRGAADLDVAADGTVVVAVCGPPLLRRFAPEAGGWSEREPLAARGFDGGAVAVAPGGWIAFTTATGIGRSGGAAARRHPSGSVITRRLDSGAYRTRWGRVFIDACLPPGTALRARFVSSDDDAVLDPVDASPPGRATGIPPGESPPLPPKAALPAGEPMVPFRRPTGRELPWRQIAADDPFETYELPVDALPGRFLWIVLELTGTSRVGPRVRELRVEAPGHALLTQLPRSWSRDEAAAAFLQRFLAPAEGLLHDLDVRAFRRELLLAPGVAPQEVLGWLAGFVGLVLDRRWPERARRELIARAYPLMRRRGTVDALTEMLGIYLGGKPVLVERWRVRGGPGAVLGVREGHARAVLGQGLRVGGAAGTDGFAVSAHRFCVLVPQVLTPEQHDVVRSVVEAHKPAHTAFDIEEVGAGMRVGRRSHLDLTAVVGPPGGIQPAVTGSTALGEATVGRAEVGSRLGMDARPGKVRVG